RNDDPAQQRRLPPAREQDDRAADSERGDGGDLQEVVRAWPNQYQLSLERPAEGELPAECPAGLSRDLLYRYRDRGPAFAENQLASHLTAYHAVDDLVFCADQPEHREHRITRGLPELIGWSRMCARDS